MNIYIENGFDSRRHYLACLADDYGVPLVTVRTLADMLGPNEDSDGLVTSVQDVSEEETND